MQLILNPNFSNKKQLSAEIFESKNLVSASVWFVKTTLTVELRISSKKKVEGPCFSSPHFVVFKTDESTTLKTLLRKTLGQESKEVLEKYDRNELISKIYCIKEVTKLVKNGNIVPNYNEILKSCVVVQKSLEDINISSVIEVNALFINVFHQGKK